MQGCAAPERRYLQRVGRRHLKTAVLVPVKPFAMAKTRLATVCSPLERETMAKNMLRNVLEAAHGLRVAIVSPANADDVRRFALIHGARFLREPEVGGLNAAVKYGVSQLAEADYERVIVVHSDLPSVRDFTWLADTAGIIVVPDRTGRGTNAISVPAKCEFNFSFGPGSFERHCEEARRCGIEPTVVVDVDGLSHDVDEPSDLDDVEETRILA